MRRIVAALLLIVLVGCGSDDVHQDDKNTDQIIACTNRGGHAVYTFNDQGISHYISCEERSP